MLPNSANWKSFVRFFAILIAVVFGLYVLPAFAQMPTEEVEEITDQEVLKKLSVGDFSVLQEEVTVADAPQYVMGYSIRHHWSYQQYLQVYVNNTSPDGFTNFQIKAQLRNGQIDERLVSANMSPQYTLFDKNGSLTDPTNVTVLPSNGGRSDSQFYGGCTPPMLTVNRWSDGQTIYPVVANLFSDTPIQYRIVGLTDWVTVYKNEYHSFRTSLQSGKIEVKLEKSEEAPTCLSASWDWDYREQPTLLATIGRVNVVPGQEFMLPVRLTGLNGRSFATATARLMVDPNFIEVQGVLNGYIASGATITLTPVRPGEQRLDFISSLSEKVIQDGDWFFIKMKSLTRGEALVLLWDLSITDDGPAIPINVQSGNVNSNAVDITTQMTFGEYTPVSGANIELRYVVTDTGITGTDGKYTFTVPYEATFTPNAKINRPTTGAISALDAAWIHQCILKTRTECPQDITDVSRNGETNLYDVYLTLRKAANYNDSDSHAGEWIVYGNDVQYLTVRQNMTHKFKSAIVGDMTFSGPVGLRGPINVATASVAPSVEITGTTQQLVVEVSDVPFNGISFAVTSTQYISVTGVQADGFQAVPNGTSVYLSNPNTVTDAKIVLNVIATEGSTISVVSMAVDEGQPSGEVASVTLVQQMPGLLTDTLLPQIEK